jgi:hypothetical protein
MVGRMKTLVVAVMLLSAAPASAQILDRAVDLANGAALVAHAADLATTTYCLGARTCTEANAILAPHVESPRTFFAIKLGTALASYAVKTRTKRDHPKLTLVFAAAETVAFALVARHNRQVHQRAAGR